MMTWYEVFVAYFLLLSNQTEQQVKLQPRPKLLD